MKQLRTSTIFWVLLIIWLGWSGLCRFLNDCDQSSSINRNFDGSVFFRLIPLFLLIPNEGVVISNWSQWEIDLLSRLDWKWYLGITDVEATFLRKNLFWVIKAHNYHFGFTAHEIMHLRLLLKLISHNNPGKILYCPCLILFVKSMVEFTKNCPSE